MSTQNESVRARCPTCGKVIRKSRKEQDAKYRAKTREKRKAYASWYYQNVTKPRRQKGGS